MTWPKLDLPRDAQELFDQARQTLKPSSLARGQVLQQLKSTLATPGLGAQPRLESVPGAPDGAASARSSGAVARQAPRALRLVATAGKTVAGKVVLGVAIAATAGLAIQGIRQGRFARVSHPRPAPSLAGPIASPAAPEHGLSPAALPVAAAPPESPVSAPPASHRTRPPPRPFQGLPRRAMGSSTPDDEDDLSYRLGLEAGLLNQARAALRRGDAIGAQASLEAHRTRFPNGSLSEEREALGVEAELRAKGPSAARSLLEGFRRRYPQSFLLPALEGAFSGSEP